MSIFDTTIELATEIRDRKKRDKLKCCARYIDDYNNIFEYEAFLHPSRKYAIVPDLKRLQIRPVVFWDGTQNLIYMPSKQANLHWKFIKGAAKGVRLQALMKLKFMKYWLNFDVVSESCIDWNILDSEIAEDFSADSHNVIQTLVLKFLSEGTDFRLLMMFLLVFMFGFGIGMLTDMVGVIMVYILGG